MIDSTIKDRSVLALAVNSRCPEIVSLLLHHGADLTWYNRKKRQTCLMRAVEKCFSETHVSQCFSEYFIVPAQQPYVYRIAELLLQNGADPTPCLELARTDSMRALLKSYVLISRFNI